MPFLFDEKLIETLLLFEKQQTGGYGMQMEQYENRKNYVESVKNSFASPGKKTYPEEQEKRPRSFLGLRFVLALFLFLGFLGMRQTDFSWHSWNAEKITQQIQSSIKFPQILEVLNRL